MAAVRIIHSARARVLSPDTYDAWISQRCPFVTQIRQIAFKLALEDRCEDYGQVATYLGTIEESPSEQSRNWSPG